MGDPLGYRLCESDKKRRRFMRNCGKKRIEKNRMVRYAQVGNGDGETQWTEILDKLEKLTLNGEQCLQERPCSVFTCNARTGTWASLISYRAFFKVCIPSKWKMYRKRVERTK